MRMTGVVGLMMVAAMVRAEAPPRFAFGSVFQQDISAAPVHPVAEVTRTVGCLGRIRATDL